MSEKISQRLVDPEICSACYGCYEVCPTGAVVIEGRRVAVDPALCNDCGACEQDCSTDAIAVKQLVTTPYSVEEQLSWDRLPAEDF